MRIFFAHRGKDPGPALAAARRTYTDDVEIVPGTEDHERRFSGDWDDWADSVSASDADGVPRYDLILVPDVQIGRVTARILETAIRRGVPVITWPGEDIVVGVREDNRRRWQDGWSVIVQPADRPPKAYRSPPPAPALPVPACSVCHGSGIALVPLGYGVDVRRCRCGRPSTLPERLFSVYRDMNAVPDAVLNRIVR